MKWYERLNKAHAEAMKNVASGNAYGEMIRQHMAENEKDIKQAARMQAKLAMAARVNAAGCNHVAGTPVTIAPSQQIVAGVGIGAVIGARKETDENAEAKAWAEANGFTWREGKEDE